MNIRPATKDDIPAMAELLHELFAIEVDFTADFETQARGLELLLDRRSALVIVAEENEQLIGMSTAQIIVSTAKGGEVGIVEDVVVDIAHRGKGIASGLMRTIEEWARNRKLARLQLQADRNNAPALCFYRQQGWQHTNLIGWMKQL